MEIKIGQRVRDVMTGFGGIAVQRVEEMSGNIRYAIQRPLAEGEIAYPDAFLIDHHTLEVVDDGVVDRVTKAGEFTIDLGSKVKDKVTGLVGIAIERSVYLNGCIRYGVVPEKEKGALLAGNPDMSYVEQDRLEVKGDGLNKEAKPASVKTPGGPSLRLSAQTARR